MSVRTRDGRYIVDYYPHGSKGKRVRLTLPLGTTEAQAHAIWQGLINRKHASSSIGQGDPIDRLARYYYEYVKMHLSPRTARDIQSCFINHIIPFFGKMHVSEIISPIITVYQKHRIREDASQEQRAINRTVNKELSYFSTFLRWIEDQTGAMISVKIKPLPYKRPLPSILSQEDIDTLIKKTEFEYQGIMMALAHLGLRIGSARQIKWPDINFETKTIRAVLKGGREIYLPMTDELHAWLKKQRTENIYGSPWAFPSKVRPMRPISDIRKAISRAKDAAGIIKRVHPHLFRHSAAAHLLESGVDIRVVQEILGHADIRMTEWYTQVSQRLKKQALTRSGRIKDSQK